MSIQRICYGRVGSMDSESGYQTVGKTEQLSKRAEAAFIHSTAIIKNLPTNCKRFEALAGDDGGISFLRIVETSDHMGRAIPLSSGLVFTVEEWTKFLQGDYRQLLGSSDALFFAAVPEGAAPGRPAILEPYEQLPENSQRMQELNTAHIVEKYGLNRVWEGRTLYQTLLYYAYKAAVSDKNESIAIGVNADQITPETAREIMYCIYKAMPPSLAVQLSFKCGKCSMATSLTICTSAESESAEYWNHIDLTTGKARTGEQKAGILADLLQDISSRVGTPGFDEKLRKMEAFFRKLDLYSSNSLTLKEHYKSPGRFQAMVVAAWTYAGNDHVAEIYSGDILSDLLLHQALTAQAVGNMLDEVLTVLVKNFGGGDREKVKGTFRQLYNRCFASCEDSQLPQAFAGTIRRMELKYKKECAEVFKPLVLEDRDLSRSRLRMLLDAMGREVFGPRFFDEYSDYLLKYYRNMSPEDVQFLPGNRLEKFGMELKIPQYWKDYNDVHGEDSSIGEFLNNVLGTNDQARQKHINTAAIANVSCGFMRLLFRKEIIEAAIGNKQRMSKDLEKWYLEHRGECETLLLTPEQEHKYIVQVLLPEIKENNVRTAGHFKDRLTAEHMVTMAETVELPKEALQGMDQMYKAWYCPAADGQKLEENLNEMNRLYGLRLKETADEFRRRIRDSLAAHHPATFKEYYRYRDHLKACLQRTGTGKEHAEYLIGKLVKGWSADVEEACKEIKIESLQEYAHQFRQLSSDFTSGDSDDFALVIFKGISKDWLENQTEKIRGAFSKIRFLEKYNEEMDLLVKDCSELDAGEKTALIEAAKRGFWGFYKYPCGDYEKPYPAEAAFTKYSPEDQKQRDKYDREKENRGILLRLKNGLPSGAQTVINAVDGHEDRIKYVQACLSRIESEDLNNQPEWYTWKICGKPGPEGLSEEQLVTLLDDANKVFGRKKDRMYLPAWLEDYFANEPGAQETIDNWKSQRREKSAQPCLKAFFGMLAAVIAACGGLALVLPLESTTSWVVFGGAAFVALLLGGLLMIHSLWVLPAFVFLLLSVGGMAAFHTLGKDELLWALIPVSILGVAAEILWGTLARKKKYKLSIWAYVFSVLTVLMIPAVLCPVFMAKSIPAKISVGSEQAKAEIAAVLTEQSDELLKAAEARIVKYRTDMEAQAAPCPFPSTIQVEDMIRLMKEDLAQLPENPVYIEETQESAPEDTAAPVPEIRPDEFEKQIEKVSFTDDELLQVLMYVRAMNPAEEDKVTLAASAAQFVRDMIAFTRHDRTVAAEAARNAPEEGGEDAKAEETPAPTPTPIPVNEKTGKPDLVVLLQQVMVARSDEKYSAAGLDRCAYQKVEPTPTPKPTKTPKPPKWATPSPTPEPVIEVIHVTEPEGIEVKDKVVKNALKALRALYTDEEQYTDETLLQDIYFVCRLYGISKDAEFIANRADELIRARENHAEEEEPLAAAVTELTAVRLEEAAALVGMYDAMKQKEAEYALFPTVEQVNEKKSDLEKTFAAELEKGTVTEEDLMIAMFCALEKNPSIKTADGMYRGAENDIRTILKVADYQPGALPALPWFKQKTSVTINASGGLMQKASTVCKVLTEQNLWTQYYLDQQGGLISIISGALKSMLPGNR